MRVKMYRSLPRNSSFKCSRFCACTVLAQLDELPAGRESPSDLVVEFGPVGDDEKRPVARLLAQHLAGEEQHRKALARPLRVPEHAEPSPVVLDVIDRAERAIDAEQLVGLRHLLDEAELALLEGDEVLDEVEKPRRPARALDQRVEADDAASSSSSIRFHSLKNSRGA